MSVENAIVQAVRKDGLNGLTIFETSEGKWQASARFDGSTGWRISVADNAPDAILDVLGAPLPANDDKPAEDIFG